MSTPEAGSSFEIPEVTFVDYLYGPTVERIFDENRSRDYVSFNVERYSDMVLNTFRTAKSFIKIIIPTFGYYLYSNSGSGSSENQGIVSYVFYQFTSFRFVFVMFTIYCASLASRAVHRAKNPVYVTFLQTFKTATASLPASARPDQQDLVTKVNDAREELRQKYDFDFDHWPVDFSWREGALKNRVPTLLTVQESGGQPQVDGQVMRALSSFMATTIGRWMLYPGSVGLLQSVINNALITGRRFLIEHKQAKRFKLEARDSNFIDSIFVDRRNESINGHNLVICSEGNAGFYEIGIMTTPIELNYSVLGWNHPGFCGSSGIPYPINDINAMEVVVNFAVTKLGFKLEDIYFFGWSIGGFPTAWAAQNYPEVKGVILDASFNDVLPLARARMIDLLKPIVDHTIRTHFNLNVSAYLNRYNGPVLLVRRLQDEMVSLDPLNPTRTNCGNEILFGLLESRFPNILSNTEVATALYNYVNSSFPNILEVDSMECLNIIRQHGSALRSFPVKLTVDDMGVLDARKLILFMAMKVMKNFNSTHCTPLPHSHFLEPFDLFKLVKK